MSRNKGVAIIVIGAVLILSALSLYIYNQIQDNNAGNESEIILAEIRSVIGKTTETEPLIETETEAVQLPIDPPTYGEPVERSVETENKPTEIKIGGYKYIGYVTIPAIKVELPIMSEWDYNRLLIAPCRQFGSIQTDDLVIAAHNYRSHFGSLKKLTTEDFVIITDAGGDNHVYAVKEIKILEPTAVEEVQNSGYDLVLYTCTTDGNTRIVVFCDRDIVE